ncbi:hypothetical protein J2P12_01095 [Candidatus Bathyarchaeota archaeon]|nr:hypothetical protein [Candidatus Bathyarchaeota archaeon]
MRSSVSPTLSQLKVQEMIIDWASRQEAEVRPMGRLVQRYKTEGENMHWHVAGLRKGMGTVEVTYSPSSGKLTVLVRDNRRGLWAGSAYKELAGQLAKTKK